MKKSVFSLIAKTTQKIGFPTFKLPISTKIFYN